MTRFFCAPVIATVSVFFAAPVVAAEIYHYKDENGRSHYADRQHHGGFQRYTPDRWKREQMRYFGYQNFRRNQKKYADLVHRMARRYGVDTHLLDALITTESAYDPRAESKAGAVGLMQLMPATARRYGATPAARYDPEANLDVGTRHFKHLLSRFKNDTQLALAAYNAGETAVSRHGNKIPPFYETRRFVWKVMRQYRQYRARR